MKLHMETKMVNIEDLKPQIVEALKPLKPDKIILFGSYAYGQPTKESDIDLLLVKNERLQNVRGLKVKARLLLKDLIKKYHIGFDILIIHEELLHTREDYFYKVDILQNGKVLYE